MVLMAKRSWGRETEIRGRASREMGQSNGPLSGGGAIQWPSRTIPELVPERLSSGADRLRGQRTRGLGAMGVGIKQYQD